MSVVNQMLRDLDRRRGGENAPVYGQHLQTASGGWGKAMVAIGLLILLALIAVIYLLLPQAQETPPIAVQPPPQKIVAAPVAEISPPQEEKPAAPPAESLVLPPSAPALVAEPVSEAPPPPPPKKASAPVPPPVVAAPAEPQTVAAKTPIQSGPAKIDVRPSTPARTAESEFKRAVALINQGRGEDARTALGEALKLDSRHEGARQTLAVMQVEAGLHEEAQALLNEGLKLNPAQTNFALLLARMKVDRGDAAGGLEVLRRHAAPAINNAQYRAFTAALLQRLGQHEEAIAEYQAALTLAPNMAVWWMGLGLSFEAAGQTREAAEAFGRARISGTLSPDLNEFVERKLQTLH